MTLTFSTRFKLIQNARELVIQALACIGTTGSRGVPTAQGVASGLGTKVRTLRYLHRQYYQQTFYVFIEEQRMETAKRLLGEIKQVGIVSNLLEYSAPQNFSRLYKKRYGISPSEYIGQLPKS